MEFGAEGIFAWKLIWIHDCHYSTTHTLIIFAPLRSDTDQEKWN